MQREGDEAAGNSSDAGEAKCWTAGEMEGVTGQVGHWGNTHDREVQTDRRGKGGAGRAKRDGRCGAIVTHLSAACERAAVMHS